MSRLLFFIVIAAVVYWLFKSYRKQSPKEGDSKQGSSGQAEDMVCCAYCGVHLPKRESILAGGKYYCCEEHRRAHAAQPE